ARPAPRLVDVARARRRTTDRPGVACRVLAVVAAAVTRVGGARVAIVGAERAGGLLGVGRAWLPGQAAAGLGDVALTGRGPAGEEVRQHDVRRAGGAYAGAHLVGIARVPGAGAADRARIAGSVLAGVVGAVAGVGRARVAVVAAGGARRALGIRRATGARAGAVLGRVALPRRGPALGERGQKTVRRAG